MSSVFFSYPSEHFNYVNDVHNLLQQKGYDVWLDRDRLQSGDKWWDKICEAIEDRTYFVTFITPEMLKSPFCLKELEYAKQLEKTIIPIVLQTSRIPAIIKDIEYMDSHGKNSSECFKELEDRLAVLRVSLSTPKRPARFPPRPDRPRLSLDELRVQDVMDRDFDWILENQTVWHAQMKMQGAIRTPYLVVKKEEDGPITGYITIGVIFDILPPRQAIKDDKNKYDRLYRKAADTNILSVYNNIANVQKLSPQSSLLEAISLFTRSFSDNTIPAIYRARSIPIINNAGYAEGVLSYWRLIEGLLYLAGIPIEGRVQDRMVSLDLVDYRVTEKTRLQEALRIIWDNASTQIVVVDDNNTLKGMIKSERVRNLCHPEFSYDQEPVVNYAHMDLTILNGKETLHDVTVKHFLERFLTALPVVQNGQVKGMISYLEILQYFKEMLEDYNQEN